MNKFNWFDCEITVYDSNGFEIDIEELPMKARREIANAIANGHKCGSYSGEVVDEELMSQLHPIFRVQLEDVIALQREANEAKDLAAAQQKLLAKAAKEEETEEINEGENECQD